MTDRQVAKLRTIIQRDLARTTQAAAVLKPTIETATSTVVREQRLYHWAVAVGQEGQARHLLGVLDRIAPDSAKFDAQRINDYNEAAHEIDHDL